MKTYTEAEMKKIDETFARAQRDSEIHRARVDIGWKIYMIGAVVIGLILTHFGIGG